jgi:hypothetical protein
MIRSVRGAVDWMRYALPASAIPPSCPCYFLDAECCRSCWLLLPSMSADLRLLFPVAMQLARGHTSLILYSLAAPPAMCVLHVTARRCCLQVRWPSPLDCLTFAVLHGLGLPPPSHIAPSACPLLASAPPTCCVSAGRCCSS